MIRIRRDGVCPIAASIVARFVTWQAAIARAGKGLWRSETARAGGGLWQAATARVARGGASRLHIFPRIPCKCVVGRLISSRRLRSSSPHAHRAVKFAPEAGIAVLIALGLDLLGEPPAVWHPVVSYGKLIQYLEKAAPRQPISQFLYGVFMLVVAAPVAWMPAAGIHLIAKRARVGTGGEKAGDACGEMATARVARGGASRLHIFPRAPRRCDVGVGLVSSQGLTLSRSLRSPVGFIISALLEGLALKPFFALRMLVQAGQRVRVYLEQGDLVAARQALQDLVSRDRSQLTSELVSAAAIESLAENLSDSLVAPLFYYLLFGLPGAATYRLFNTFDSMIGYHGQYEYLGKAAARLDDILNFIPARLTALLIIACAPLFGGKRDNAWRIWRRDAHKTASPNAGHPMAAIAGALGLQLEKVGHYTLGDNERTITTHDIQRAEQMVWWIGIGYIVLVGFIKMFWRGRDE